MTALRKLSLISVDDYLAGELSSQVKHEYLGGYVYAMAGGTNAHNIIGGNIFAALHARLRNQKCRPFNSDTKIRLRLPTQTRFYYPDCSVICRPNPQGDSFQDDAAALFEVISRDSRRIDEGEKKDNYLTIPSLWAYAIVEQSSADVAVYRRKDAGFELEVFEGLNAIIPLPELGIELPLSEIYRDVEFIPEPPDEDQLLVIPA
jgi:Uma2 family endonuclease